VEGVVGRGPVFVEELGVVGVELRRPAEAVVGGDERRLPVEAALGDGSPQREGFDVLSGGGQVLQVAGRQRPHLETVLWFALGESLLRQAQQRLAQDSHAGAVELAQLAVPQALPGDQPAGQDVRADPAEDAVGLGSSRRHVETIVRDTTCTVDLEILLRSRRPGVTVTEVEKGGRLPTATGRRAMSCAAGSRASVTSVSGSSLAGPTRLGEKGTTNVALNPLRSRTVGVIRPGPIVMVGVSELTASIPLGLIMRART
jgi:hypothetical protein